jgi:hypothetical protein
MTIEKLADGERDARLKLKAQGTSMYFDRGYSPADEEVDEMIAICKDLKIGGFHCDGSMVSNPLRFPVDLFVIN